MLNPAVSTGGCGGGNSKFGPFGAAGPSRLGTRQNVSDHRQNRAVSRLFRPVWRRLVRWTNGACGARNPALWGPWGALDRTGRHGSSGGWLARPLVLRSGDARTRKAQEMASGGNDRRRLQGREPRLGTPRSQRRQGS